MNQINLRINKKQLLLISFLIIFSPNAFSQKRVHIVTLSPKGPLEKKEFFITQVIDNRQNRTSIGIVQKGMANRPVPAIFDIGLEFQLMKAFSVLLPVSKTPLIARINKLYISEKTAAFSELGRCEMEIEFLKNIDGELYTLGEFYSKVDGKGMDVTKKHDERIIEAMVSCINQYSKSVDNPSDLKLAQPKDKEIEYSFNFEQPLKKGLYLNYKNMLNNTPNNTLEYDVKVISGKSEMQRYRINYKGRNKRIKGFFAYSDESRIYLNATAYSAAEYFIPAQLLGRYIYFEDVFTPKNMNQMAYMYGAMGALLAGAAGSKKRGIVLDTKTGLIHVLTKQKILELLYEHDDLTQEYLNGKDKTKFIKPLIKKLNERQYDEP